MRFPFGFVAQVERAGGFDAHGNAKDVELHEIASCVRDQQSTTETVNGQQVSVTREVILCDDADANVRHEDILILPDGTRWEVTGEVDRPRNPFTGWQPGCVIPVERATGASVPQEG